MGGAFQPDRDALGETEPTADLVLGAPALLGIFFAAALLAAVCFGFGYSSGHTVRRTPLVESDETASASQPESSVSRAHSPAAAMVVPDTPEAAPAVTNQTGTGTEPGFPPDEAPVPAARKPSPAQDYAAAKPPVQAGNPAAMQDLPATHSAAPQVAYAPPAHPLTAAPRMNQPPAAAMNAAPTVSPEAAPRGTAAVPAEPTEAAASAPGLSLMVQIAAVSHASDAQTLASALRHDGFSAIVRTSTGDPLFHVQLGPFPTLQAAKAMRARLAGDGYNAFIKP